MDITMEQLYEEMKKALFYFGLHFSAMDQVKVRMAGDLGQIIFTHDDRHIALQIGKPLILPR